MVALVIKNLIIPNLSLSRASSPVPSPVSTSSSTSSSATSSATSTRPSSMDSKADVAPAVRPSERRPSIGHPGASLLRSTSSQLPTSATATPLPLSRPPSDSRSKSRPLPGTPGATRRSPTTGAVIPLHTHSQPPLSRTGTGLKSLLPSSGKATPNGANTPLANQSQGARGVPALHNLEESYVGKVSLRLGEAVNRVFLPVPGSAELGWNGRSAPRWAKAKEVGELVVQELHASLHDVYLLRTLLRSSVLKSLSLFLTRLTTLLIPAQAGTSFAPPLTVKDVDTLPPALRFNLAVVRSAYELKEGLRAAGVGAPPFVGETLRPWVDKLEELMGRVMNPLVASVRLSVTAICTRARIAEPSVAVGQPELKSTSLPGAAGLRSLSLGRTASANVAATTSVGPVWIRELAAALETMAKLVGRLECGKDADKWLVSVGTCAVWKAMLALSARNVVEEVAIPAAVVPAAPKGLFKSAKRSPSPPASPPLAPIDSLHPRYPSPLSSSAEIAFVRLLCELELLESRLTTFVNALSSAPHDNVLMSGTCDLVSACGLCKTGRTFDAESSDEEDEVDAGQGLAQCAMREALQALSAMIVVVRASARPEVLRQALLVDAGASDPLVPLTPLALLAGPPLVPIEKERGPTICPTLAHALDTLPTLILLHVLASRLPPSIGFRLPHQVWGLEWREYDKELRGFAAAEEWTAEIGWEMSGEVGRIVEGRGMGERERERVRVLGVAIRTRVRVEVVEV